MSEEFHREGKYAVAGIDDIAELIQLVRDNDDVANFAGGCDEGTIAAAEQALGVRLPPSYRAAVAALGTWDIAGEEFLGVFTMPTTGDQLLGSVWETLDARRKFALPVDLVVVMFDGSGDLVVLDASAADARGEYPVLVWNPGIVTSSEMERLDDDFGSFALRRCTRAVERWRESEASQP